MHPDPQTRRGSLALVDEIGFGMIFVGAAVPTRNHVTAALMQRLVP